MCDPAIVGSWLWAEEEERGQLLRRSVIRIERGSNSIQQISAPGQRKRCCRASARPCHTPRHIAGVQEGQLHCVRELSGHSLRHRCVQGLVTGLRRIYILQLSAGLGRGYGSWRDPRAATTGHKQPHTNFILSWKTKGITTMWSYRIMDQKPY